MSNSHTPLAWGTCLIGACLIAACAPRAGARPTGGATADPAVPRPIPAEAGTSLLRADRLSVEILLRAAADACARQGSAVDVLEAEPARDGQAAFVHYRCTAPDPHEQVE